MSSNAEPTARVGLTDAEKDALIFGANSRLVSLVSVVETIVADRVAAARGEERERLAAVEALAAEWEQDYPSSHAACNREVDEWWLDLRAALARPTDTKAADQ